MDTTTDAFMLLESFTSGQDNSAHVLKQEGGQYRLVILG